MIKFDDSFNWLAVLKDLAAGAPLSDLEHAQLVSMAGQWPDCACGQLCAGVPRLPSLMPVDLRLRDLGHIFMLEIGLRCWKNAINCFRAIEKRTAELLSQQTQ